jgi:hypothetical protein
MPRLLAALLLSAALAGTARAEGPLERFAPLQLQLARQSMREARLRAAADPVRAERLARQANLDARLAWGMSDSPFVRAAAVAVAGDSTALLRQLGMRASRSADASGAAPIE